MHDDRCILLVPFDRGQNHLAEQFEARLAALIPDVTVLAVPGMRGTTTWLLTQAAPTPDPEPKPARRGPAVTVTATGHVTRPAK